MILKDLREQYDLTQQEAAKRTGIPYNTCRRYEYGQREPGFKAIVALAKLYNLRPGELFEMLALPECSHEIPSLNVMDAPSAPQEAHTAPQAMRCDCGGPCLPGAAVSPVSAHGKDSSRELHPLPRNHR